MIIIIRIPDSLTKPHMITFQYSNKFYARNSTGKYLLDVGEIKNLVLASEGAIEKIDNFRKERLGQIIAGETPIPTEKPKVVIHLAPLSMSFGTKQLDMRSLKNQESLLPMRLESHAETRYNFDGLLQYKVDIANQTYTYSHLFRNGCIEAVEAFTLTDKYGLGKVIPSIRIESELINTLKRYLFLLNQNEIEPPIFIMVSLLGVRGYKMIYKQEMGILPGQHSIDRDNLLFDEIVIETFDTNYSKVMKPIFNSIWNSCGLVGSMNYDESGDWKISDDS